MLNYLSKEAEKTPAFLENYEVGKKICFGRALKNRVAFYPGSRCDMSFIDCLNDSQSVHIYIYADYLSPEKVIEEFRENGYNGYHILDEFDVPIKKSIMNDYLKAREKRIEESPKKTAYDEGEKVICHTFIFERNEDNKRGTDRFMLIYLSMDAFYLYKLLFNNDKVNLFVTLIQDHGFGCNYDRFGREGLLNKIAYQNSIYPEYMLYRNTNHDPWQNYDEVEEAKPAKRFNGDLRYLYKFNLDKKDIFYYYDSWEKKYGEF